MGMEYVESAVKGIGKPVIHAEFDGISFLRIQVFIAIWRWRIKVIKAGGYEEGFIVDVVIGLFVLLIAY